MFTSFFFEVNNFCHVSPRISSKTQSFISLHWLHFELINLGHLLSCGKNDTDLMFNLLFVRSEFNILLKQSTSTL